MEAAEKLAREAQVLMDQPVTVTFGHLYSLMFGFAPEQERTIDYMNVSSGFAAFIQKLDPQALRVTVVGTEVWRTAAYRTSYKAHQARKNLQLQRLVEIGEKMETQTTLFKALRRAGFSVGQADRMAALAAENEDTRKIVEGLCH